RPLWEMYVVEGLEHGHIASITKTHHAAIDGVSGAELTVNLLDLQPEPTQVPPPETPWEPDRIPSDAELVAYAVNSLARQPFRAAKAVRRTALAAVNVRRRNRLPDAVPPPAPFSAPHTPFNVSIDGRRRFAFTEIPPGPGQAREQHKAIGADTPMDWTEFAAPARAARPARLYSRMKVADRLRPLFNVTISNVPGPPFPLYCAGSRMVALYPMGPI